MTDEFSLEVRDINFTYESGDSPLFVQFSAGFTAGEMVAITGASGRGKSTMLYILGLLLTPDSGDVLVSGKGTKRLSDAKRASMRANHFGFVFQDAALDGSRSILDNVCEPALYRGQGVEEVRTRAIYLLEKFDVLLRSSAKPSKVSGGQAQRISLARALLHHPKILLCDEPTGNLDHESSDLVIRALREHADNGGCVVIVTHSNAVVEACDRRIRL